MFEDNIKGACLSSASVGSGQANAEHPAMPIFREYCKVKAEFDDACHAVATNQQRQAMSEKRLIELSNKIQAMMEDGQHNPTVPRAAVEKSYSPSPSRTASGY